jgi:hypothetical protein
MKECDKSDESKQAHACGEWIGLGSALTNFQQTQKNDIFIAM